MRQGLDRRVIAHIDQQVHDRLAVPEHPGAAGLVVPERPAVGPDGVVAVQAVLPAVRHVAGDDVQRGLVGGRADHKLIDQLRVGEVRQHLERGGRVAVLGIREGLSGGDGLAVDVCGGSAVHDVETAVDVARPELALRLVHQALGTDVVGAEAQLVARGLGGEAHARRAAEPVQFAVVILRHGVRERAAQVCEEALRPRGIPNGAAAQDGQPGEQVITVVFAEIPRQVRGPVLRARFVAVHRHAQRLGADAGERVDDPAGIGDKMQPGGLPRHFVAFEAHQVGPAVLDGSAGRLCGDPHDDPVSRRDRPVQRPVGPQARAQVQDPVRIDGAGAVFDGSAGIVELREIIGLLLPAVRPGAG